MYLKTIVLSFFLINNLFAVTIENLKVKTPRGAEVDVRIHLPDTRAPLPAVVIGAGQGYHMDLPLIDGLARKLTDAGYVAVRFNWNYFSNGGSPSENLVNELEDYATVVRYIISHSRINSKKIIAAGKSLGSIISYRYFTQDKNMLASFLLTPVCTSRWDNDGNEVTPFSVAKENYPELLRDKRQIVLSLGNKDPHCNLPMLYDFLKHSRGNISTLIFEGDHSLNVGPYNDPNYTDRNNANFNAAIEGLTHWAALIFNAQ